MYTVRDVSKASHYIADAGRGWGALSAAMLERLSEFHEFYTLSPGEAEDLVNGSIKGPGEIRHYSGAIAVQIQNDVPLLAAFLKQEMLALDGFALIESPLATSKDIETGKRAGRAAFVDSSVLFTLFQSDSEAEILNAILEADFTFGHSVAVVSKAAVTSLAQGRSTLSREQLESVANEAQWLITSVYNGETFLIGRRDSIAEPLL